MRVLAVVLALAVLPAAADPIGYDGARHLLARTGFGVTESEVQDFAGLTREEAVDRILAGVRREPVTPPPASMLEAPTPFTKVRAMSREERMAWNRVNFQQGLELREWWLTEMLATDSPFTERMTLFWHGHFATSQQKVRQAQLLYRQNLLLRELALGDFRVMLKRVARDPAMLLYLDNAQSTRLAPNENFAREVMELFTLGEGRYTERDVKEAARAFTGWSIDRDTLDYRYRRAAHDAGVKTVFGTSGRLDGDEVLELILARPEVARFIAGKLWRELVSPTPDEAELSRAARAFRDSRYQVKPLVRALLLSDAFWDPRNRGTLIRSPVDLVVGTLHTFEIRPASLRPAAFAVALLGQNLFSPPNVKGWPGGEAWIDSTTLLARKQLVERLFRGGDAMVMGATAPAATMERAGGGREENMRRRMERGMASYAFDPARWRSSGATELARLVLPIAPVNPLPAEASGADLVRHLVADPAYQLQ